MLIQQSGEPTWPVTITSIGELVDYWSTPTTLSGYDLREAIFETFSAGMSRRFPYGGYGFRLFQFAYPSPPPMVNEGRFIVGCLEESFPRDPRPQQHERAASFPSLEASRWQAVDAALEQFLDAWLYSPRDHFRIPPDNDERIPDGARSLLRAPWRLCVDELAPGPDARGMHLFGACFRNVDWGDAGSALALRSASSLHLLVVSWVTD